VEEAYFHAAPRSLPDEPYWPSPKRSADEAHHCAVLLCFSPQRRVGGRCSLHAQPTAWLLAELWHSCLQAYKALLLVWPVQRRGR